MNEAVKGLLKAAGKSPPGTTSLEGESGLVATLEESTAGPARMIKVLDGQELVCWSFFLQPDEPQPQFYPKDLPFLPETTCVVNWFVGSGLSVLWPTGLGEDYAASLLEFKGAMEEIGIPQSVKDVAEKVDRGGKKVTASLWKEVQNLVPTSFVESVSDAAKGIFGSEMPAEVVDQADTISDFFLADGWVPGTQEEPSGHSLTRTFEKLGRRRDLTVRWLMGQSIISLHEKDPSASSD